MKKLLIIIMLLMATPCFSMSRAPAKLNVNPDTLIDGKYPATFSGANASINSDYLHSVGVYPKGDVVKVQFRVGTNLGDLSYCINLPPHEVGLVGRKAFNKSNNEYNSGVNPRTDALGTAIEISGKNIRLNPKDIEAVYVYSGFVADKNKNGCNNPYGQYPNWQFNIIMTMSVDDYNDSVKPQLIDAGLI